jgi:hypothetical protein
MFFIRSKRQYPDKLPVWISDRFSLLIQSFDPMRNAPRQHFSIQKSTEHCWPILVGLLIDVSIAENNFALIAFHFLGAVLLSPFMMFLRVEAFFQRPPGSSSIVRAFATRKPKSHRESD